MVCICPGQPVWALFSIFKPPFAVVEGPGPRLIWDTLDHSPIPHFQVVGLSWVLTQEVGARGSGNRSRAHLSVSR